MPTEFFEHLKNTYRLKAWIDFGVADGQLATWPARFRVPYAGICLSDGHKMRVRSRCIQQLLESSFTEGSGDRMPCDLKSHHIVT